MRHSQMSSSALCKQRHGSRISFFDEVRSRSNAGRWRHTITDICNLLTALRLLPHLGKGRRAKGEGQRACTNWWSDDDDTPFCRTCARPFKRASVTPASPCAAAWRACRKQWCRRDVSPRQTCWFACLVSFRCVCTSLALHTSSAPLIASWRDRATDTSSRAGCVVAWHHFSGGPTEESGVPRRGGR